MARRGATRRGFVLFATGFRPFFLGAGFYGALVLPIWLALYLANGGASLAWPPVLWHAHEMLMGYAAAALAGFLLTAVPSWQKTAPIAPPRLAALAALWLAGRVAVWMAAALPAWLVAVVDLAFLPALLAVGVPELLRPGARRNRIFVAVISVLIAGNALMHAGAAELIDERLGAMLVLDGFALLITILGGRVVPAFTAGALATRGLRDAVGKSETLDRLSILGVVLFVATDALAEAWPAARLAAGALAVAAALVNGLRLSRWGWRHVLGEPIVWILHLAYGWLVVGLAARGLADFGLIAPLASMHALAVGAVGSMTLAIMSRAALGHSGRPLVAPWPVAMAYGLVSVAAIARMIDGTAGLIVAGTAWTTAFAAFSAVFLPILARPRSDGRPG